MGTPILSFFAIVGVMYARLEHRNEHRVSLVTGLVLRKIKRFFEAVTIAAPVDIIVLRRLLAFGLCGLEVCRYFAADGLLSLGHGITTPLLQMAFLQMPPSDATFRCPARRKAQCGALLSGRLRRAHGPAPSALTDRPRPGALRRPGSRRGGAHYAPPLSRPGLLLTRPATASALRQVTTDRPRPARRSPPSASGPGRSGPPRPCAGSAGPPLAAQARPPGPQTLGAVSARALALRRPAGGAICNGTRGTRGTRRTAASEGRLLCRCRRITLGYARGKPAHNVSLCAIAAPKDRHSNRPRVRAGTASASASAAQSVAVPPLCGQPVGHCAGLPAVHTRRHRRRAWRWGIEHWPGRQGPPPARPSAPRPSPTQRRRAVASIAARRSPRRTDKAGMQNAPA